MKKLLIVAGTRPNFIKITRFKTIAASIPDFDVKIVHTGQHYDQNMAQVFFSQLKLRPDYFLGVSTGNPAERIGSIMKELPGVIHDYRPDLLMVLGDVDSTLAAAIVANKLGLPLAHLESGLRSGDRNMPEEINRILTDEISDFCFVTEKSGKENLIADGKSPAAIHFVGNTMIDTLVHFNSEIMASTISSDLGLEDTSFGLMTMHRPRNVDKKESLEKLVKLIESVCLASKVVFPMHPRTKQSLERTQLIKVLENDGRLIITEPLGYFAFQKLIVDCKYVLTDSGGIQEETTFRKKPCITLRPSTERPCTVDIGSNTLANFNIEEVQSIINSINDHSYKKAVVPPLWDGHATERVIDILKKEV